MTVYIIASCGGGSCPTTWADEAGRVSLLQGKVPRMNRFGLDLPPSMAAVTVPLTVIADTVRSTRSLDDPHPEAPGIALALADGQMLIIGPKASKEEIMEVGAPHDEDVIRMGEQRLGAALRQGLFAGIDLSGSAPTQEHSIGLT